MNQTELQTQLTDVTTQANMAVTDQATYDQAGDIIRAIKAVGKAVGDVFDPIVEKAHAAHKEATTQRKKFLDPLLDAEKKIKASMSAWFQAENASRQEEERKERQRIEAEQASIKAKQDAEAAAMADLGLDEEAEAVAATPIAVQPVTHYEAPKSAGVSMRDNWSFQVTDPDALPRMYLMPDMERLNSLAKTMKASTNIPGGIAVNVPSVAIR
jgi:hypothetical protein